MVAEIAEPEETTNFKSINVPLPACYMLMPGNSFSSSGKTDSKTMIMQPFTVHLNCLPTNKHCQSPELTDETKKEFAGKR